MNKFTQINTRTITNTTGTGKTKTETNIETDAFSCSPQQWEQVIENIKRRSMKTSHFVNMRHASEAHGHTIASGDQPAMQKCLAEGVEWLIQNRGYVEAKAPIGRRPDHFVLTNHAEGKTLECWISTKPIKNPG